MTNSWIESIMTKSLNEMKSCLKKYESCDSKNDKLSSKQMKRLKDHIKKVEDEIERDVEVISEKWNNSSALRIAIKEYKRENPRENIYLKDGFTVKMNVILKAMEHITPKIIDYCEKEGIKLNQWQR